MIDLTNYKILKYKYELSAEELENVVWDNMTEEEVKWSVQITLDGINDTSPLETKKAWDLFFLNDELKNQIDNILDKYKVVYTITDLTNSLEKNPKKHLTNFFIEKLDEFLYNNLDVDGVLDRILEVGVENITPFEKYFLDNDINPDKKFL
jgi:galactitol-specific phosphotransferase system IIB component